MIFSPFQDGRRTNDIIYTKSKKLNHLIKYIGKSVILIRTLINYSRMLTVILNKVLAVDEQKRLLFISFNRILVY